MYVRHGERSRARKTRIAAILVLFILAIMMVLLLRAGIARRPLDEGTALLVTSGTARLYRHESGLFGQQSGQPVTISAGEQVFVRSNESVILDASAQAHLNVSDETLVELSPDSAVRFVALQVRPESYLVRLNLAYGGLTGRVQPLPSDARFEISTKQAVVSVNDAAFTVEVPNDDTTQVVTQAGDVIVASEREQVVVRRGTRLVAVTGEPFRLADSDSTVAGTTEREGASHALQEAGSPPGEPSPTTTARTAPPDEDASPPPTTTGSDEAPTALNDVAQTNSDEPIAVVRCAETVAVDGVLEPSAYLTVQAVSIVVHGENRWAGPDDLSGQLRLCWTDTALHLIVEVDDDIHAQTMTGLDIWQGDEVEIVFDGDVPGDEAVQRLNGDDLHLGLSPGDFRQISPSAVQYQSGSSGAVDGVEITAQPSAGKTGGYVLEAAVPWSVFRVTPSAGGTYGFCAAISDNDQPGQARQDSLISHCPLLRVTDPMTWVVIELQE